jgi:hypothetical protein
MTVVDQMGTERPVIVRSIMFTWYPPAEIVVQCSSQTVTRRELTTLTYNYSSNESRQLKPIFRAREKTTNLSPYYKQVHLSVPYVRRYMNAASCGTCAHSTSPSASINFAIDMHYPHNRVPADETISSSLTRSLTRWKYCPRYYKHRAVSIEIIMRASRN